MVIKDINDKVKTWKNLKAQDRKLGNISGVRPANSKLILDFLKDFEDGKNVGSVKGRRSPATLTKYRHQLVFFDKQFKTDFTKITKTKAHDLFNKMMAGKLKKKTGKKYLGVGEFIKNFKTFWGWMLRMGHVKENITEDLSQAEGNGIGRKPSWVFLGPEKMKRLIDNARGDYRALILFIYDSGIRPSELYRLRAYDLREECTILHIPAVRENGEKVSKTFERKIKLMQSASMMKEYIKTNKLKPSDYLVKVGQPAFNKYLRTLGKKLFGSTPTEARQSADKLKLYDIRHNSACFWVERYNRNIDLMYRFGWKKEDKVFYYSEFIGKADKIDDEDMMTKEDKSKYENEIEALTKKRDEDKKTLTVFKNEMENELKELQEAFGELTKLLIKNPKDMKELIAQTHKIKSLKISPVVS